MAKHSRTLLLMASKLGFSEEDKLLSKAAELERLLQMKSTATTNITDTGKVVICLDLAATHFGIDLDMKQAIKFSGLRSSVYTNCKKVIENLLVLNNNKVTTSLICASLQCSGIQELADRILEEYQKKAKMEIDLNLPQYVCMAVFQACRLNKVKISKSKLIEKSRLKPIQWTKLDAEWSKFAGEHFANAKKGRKSKITVTHDIEQKMDIDISTKKDDTQLEPQMEPYAEWKRRILETAYREVRKLQQKNKEIYKDDRGKQDYYEACQVDRQMTPRRSPRKTPQKFEPYKSPTKSKGVRLLFPLNF